MRYPRVSLSLIVVISLVGGYVAINLPLAVAQLPLPRGYTAREMFSRGAIRDQKQRTREKLRQLRFQEARMPQDIRAMLTTPRGQPGDARPEILEHLQRDRTRFVAGGWLWNSGAVPIYNIGGASLTGPAKGASYPVDNSVEYDITDPEGTTVQREQSIIEWWELSERTRGQRAEFFRARFGAAQQLRTMPSEEGELPQTGQREISPPGTGGTMLEGLGPPGGGVP